MLSVQVHPSDINTDLLPGGETGKTEAWIVLEVGTESRIYAGLKPGCTEENLRHALANKTIGNYLECFIPRPGDAVYIPAGTIHSLGGDLMVFEVQQNSDVTFRLYDWDHVDDRTGQLRPLQVDQAIACIDFSQGIIGPVNRMVKAEEPVQREQLILCEHFGLWRIRGESPFIVGTAGMPRVLVCIDGNGHVEHEGASYPIEKGDVMLLPVVVGACVLHPDSGMSVLEISLPEGT
jgi:mannose-6-phosphate isomerase